MANKDPITIADCTAHVGDEVLIKENNVPTSYIVVHIGRPSILYDSSCDGIWLMRKNVDTPNWPWSYSREMKWWGDIYYKNDYAKSCIHKTLNEDFLQRFDEEQLRLIKRVRIPYRPGSVGKDIRFGAEGLLCKAFLLSGYEVGWSNDINDSFPTDGFQLDYFKAGESDEANEIRIGYTKEGKAMWWALRSPSLHSTYNSWLVREDGKHRPFNANGVTGIRPCIIVSEIKEWQRHTRK